MTLREAAFPDSPARGRHRIPSAAARSRAAKLVGLLLLVLFILVLAFIRFGKTIPWGAR